MELVAHKEICMTFKEIFSGWSSRALDGGEVLYSRQKKTVFLYAVVYIILLGLMRNWLAGLPILFLLLCMALFFAFHAFFLMYCSVIGQTRTLLTYRSGGKVAWFFSRRWLMFLINVIMAIVLSFLSVIRLIEMPSVDFCIMGVTLFVMATAYGIITRWVFSESIPLLAYRRVMFWMLLGSVVVTFLLQAGVMLLGGYDFPLYADIQEALDSRTFVTVTGSNIINHVLNASSFLQTCELYFISQAMRGNILYYIAIAFLSALSFGSILVIFLVVVLPTSEWRRIFVSQCIHSTLVPPCNSKNVFWFSVVGTLIFLASAFIFADIDARVGDFSVEKQVESIKKTSTDFVVELDGVLYRGGFYDELQNYKREFKIRYEQIHRDAMVAQARICGAMEANVDRFLDWYYSLGAEYARIATTLVGDGAKYVQDKLEENLRYGIDESSIQLSVSALNRLTDEFNARVSRAKEKYRLSEEVSHRIPCVKLPETFASIEDQYSSITFNSRMVSSAGVASVAAVVAAKALSKPAVKVAAATLGKLVAGKLVTGAAVGGSTGVGASIGAAIGSVVPVVGTAIGAAAGGLIAGAAAWVGVDFVMVNLEEYISRDELRQELLQTVRESCS